MATPRLPRHSTFLSLRLDSWWSHPFVLESPDPPSVPDLHALLGERLGRTSANVFYLSGNTSDPSDVRRMSVGRALRRLDGEVPSYTIATVSPRRWRTLLALLGSPEPQVWGPMVDRRRLPERECEAALAAANVTAAFEKAIHWRMLAIGGGAGAGMGLHVDSPPVSNLHLQLRGRKEWTLCPPPGRPTAAGAGAGCMREIVGAGSTLFYPEGWSHATRTLDAGPCPSPGASSRRPERPPLRLPCAHSARPPRPSATRTRWSAKPCARACGVCRVHIVRRGDDVKCNGHPCTN